MPGDMGQTYKNDTTIFDIFPFLLSFPFHDYSITLEQGVDYLDDLGIDPVVLSAGGGGIATPDFVNFQHTGEENKITLSFYTCDINFIINNCDNILKFDDVRKSIDEGLDSEDILTKLKSIKIGEKLVRKIGKSLVAGSSFNKLLDDLLKHNKHSLRANIIRDIKLKKIKVSEYEYTKVERSIIESFYDLHLHHLKILLGIVIAIKIY
tara:strand:+ start:271 stop:894 length:624 start_codon:yes stop_codon:yes gene_type:complete